MRFSAQRLNHAYNCTHAGSGMGSETTLQDRATVDVTHAWLWPAPVELWVELWVELTLQAQGSVLVQDHQSGTGMCPSV